MRASKYNPATRAKLLMNIRDGRMVKDDCSNGLMGRKTKVTKERAEIILGLFFGT